MDHSRKYDGFDELSRGMDGGRAASLIGRNQVAAAINATFRGSFIKTRPPVWKHNLTFDSVETQTRWTGKYQGAVFYESDTPAHIVSRGGRLFRVEADGTFLVTEITPQLPMTVTADMMSVGNGALVIIDVTSETPFTLGQSLLIDSGSYTVTNRFANKLELLYNGGAANATVDSGATIFDSSGDFILEVKANPSSLDFVYLFQAENYVIVLAGQQRPIIYDGSTARLATVKEVPSGILGIYVWGRIWIVLPDGRNFVAGDLRNTTTLNDYSDILKFTENEFWNEGGTFGVPYQVGRITAMQALTTQDASLGQGNLLVGTRNSVFSVNTPVDRTIWKDLRWPIQTVALPDYGPVGPRYPLVNGDWWYRAIDGFRSFIVARRDIQVWGNTPMSREISPLTDYDSDDLLFFGSGILFDNRLLMTVSPHRTDLGIAHRGLVALNFDLSSTIQGKAMPAWDGAWSGLEFLQLLKGNSGGMERGWAWVANDDCLELWEFKKEKDATYDQVTGFEDNQTVITRVPIESSSDTRTMDFGLQYNLKELRMGDLFIEDIVDDVTITIKFRPDNYPKYITWATVSFCTTVSKCTWQASEGTQCLVWKPNARGYVARIRLPKPSEVCNELAGIPVDRGYEFQFRLEWTGHLLISRFRPHTNLVSMEMEGDCQSEEAICKSLEDCGPEWFGYNAMPFCGGSLGKLPAARPPPPEPPFGCIDAPFESETFESSIDGTVEAPTRPGSFARIIPFAGTAGQNLNLWMHSPAFDTYLILIDPDGIVEAFDDSNGYDPEGSFGDSSSIRVTLAKTGTYQIVCTTYSPGQTGDFTLVTTPSVVNTTIFCGTGNGNFMRDLMYVPVTQRIWAFNQIGNFSSDNEYWVINPANNTVQTSFNTPGSIVGARIPPARSIYNTLDDKIYVVTNDGILWRIDPTTFAFTALGPITGSIHGESDLGMAWDSGTNRIFCSLETTIVRAWDLDTNVTTDINTGETHPQNLAAINGFIYCATTTGKLLKINATTFAVTDTGIGCRANNPNVKATETPFLLFANATTINVVNVIDPATDTVVATFPGGGVARPFEFACWNACAERVYVSLSNPTGAVPQLGVVWYDPVAKKIDNYVISAEASGMAYDPVSKRVYLGSQSDANIVVVS